MTDGNEVTTPVQSTTIDATGKVMHDGMCIGLVDTDEYVQGEGGWKVEPVIMLNLAWCKMAGVHVRVLDDPDVDHHRDGKVLDR